MAFKVRRNLFSLPRIHSAKQWGLGWTVSEAARAAQRRAGTEPSQLLQCSGPYALLAGSWYREGMGRGR